MRPRGLFPNVHASPTSLLALGIATVLTFWGPRLLRWLGVTANDVTSAHALPPGELSATGHELTYARLAFLGVLFALSVAALTRSSPFLYFQF